MGGNYTGLRGGNYEWIKVKNCCRLYVGLRAGSDINKVDNLKTVDGLKFRTTEWFGSLGRKAPFKTESHRQAKLFQYMIELWRFTQPKYKTHRIGVKQALCFKRYDTFEEFEKAVSVKGTGLKPIQYSEMPTEKDHLYKYNPSEYRPAVQRHFASGKRYWLDHLGKIHLFLPYHQWAKGED